MDAKNVEDIWGKIKHVPKGVEFANTKSNCELKETTFLTNAFNEYFATIDKNMANTIPTTSKFTLSFFCAPQRDVLPPKKSKIKSQNSKNLRQQVILASHKNA